MCKEVLQIVQRMDLKNVESQLALQCAPFIMNIRISNLFMIESENESEVRLIFKNTGISYFRLVRHGGKTAFLLFRRNQLEKYLSNPKVAMAFKNLGYERISLGYLLREFQERYKSYLECGGEFPHEMGYVLGYDPDDVNGFILNNGKNYLYSGYWRVYSNVQRKMQLFSKYEEAKVNVIQLLANDINMRLIIEIYKEEPTCRLVG